MGSGKFIDLNSRDAKFESRSGHRLSSPFRGFSQSLEENSGLVPQSGRDLFVPNAFKALTSHPAIGSHEMLTAL
jgi:hypothetical protein